jgi:MOSC domain-containing protein YiiM
MATLQSLNVGAARRTDHSDISLTGIDKRPVEDAVDVTVPAAKGVGGSGIGGDEVCDRRHHGGPDQAVYAYAAEDLAVWSAEIGRELPSGSFGENMTTTGLDVSGARIGERWQVGDDVVLEVAIPRIPCRTFACFIGEPKWGRRFTERAAPGAYLRVITPGRIRAGDEITVIHRPDHEVTIELTFRALTTAPELLPLLLDIPELPAETRQRAARRAVFELDD